METCLQRPFSVATTLLLWTSGYFRLEDRGHSKGTKVPWVIGYLYVITLLQIKKRVFYIEFQVDINWQKDAQIPNGVYEVRDMWQHENLGIIESTDSLWSLGTIGFHDNRAFRLKLVQNSIKNNFLP